MKILNCPYCLKVSSPSECRPRVLVNGSYYRTSDRKWVRKFRCLKCGKYFSPAGQSAKAKQKKRHLNETIRKLFVSGVSQRRIALLLKISRTTVSRKLCSQAIIKSDENPHYPETVKKYFPNGRHEAYKGQRGSIVGQGELKKVRFDPLFRLNHTCAMFRANVNRLFRKTWCTTKKPERLAKHLAIYAHFHNTSLL